jgi:hypothetical protein
MKESEVHCNPGWRRATNGAPPFVRGKKTLEAAILKEAFERVPGSKKTAAAAAVEGRFPMKTAAEVIGVSHSNLIDKGTLPSPLVYAKKSFPPG